jgi:hypothetical protein
MLSKIELKKLMNIALSDKQILKAVDYKTNLILYPDICKIKKIDDMLGKFGSCIILYESKPNYGHWTCIFKVDSNEIEFFNSYGDSSPYEGYPDGSLDFIPDDFRIVSNQNYSYLSKLLIDSPYNLSYNQYDFQSGGIGIKTCGRHVANRLNFRNLSLDEYYKFIKYYCNELNLSPDEVVTTLTQNIK